MPEVTAGRDCLIGYQIAASHAHSPPVSEALGHHQCSPTRF